jgi:hypothetical protein
MVPRAALGAFWVRGASVGFVEALGEADFDRFTGVVGVDEGVLEEGVGGGPGGAVAGGGGVVVDVDGFGGGGGEGDHAEDGYQGEAAALAGGLHRFPPLLVRVASRASGILSLPMGSL